MTTVVLEKDVNEKTTYSAVRLLESKGYKNIKVNLPDYEQPTKFIEKETEESIMPDLTAQTLLGKDYFEIVDNKDKNKNKVISRWKLFANLAKIKNGKFFLLVTHGYNAYAQKMLKKYEIDANVLKLTTN